LCGKFIAKKFLKGLVEMTNAEYLERVGGSYIPKDKVEIFCVSDTDNTNFEVKIAERDKVCSHCKYFSDVRGNPAKKF